MLTYKSIPFTPQNMTFQHAKGHVLETQKTQIT